mmetsp:Transcript_48087/g.88610  ORF Transcript_48087/g.88610 Transcript_48087/m.88610 type:complete len:307 (+) Transcript_48087:118-1038(+)
MQEELSRRWGLTRADADLEAGSLITTPSHSSRRRTRDSRTRVTFCQVADRTFPHFARCYYWVVVMAIIAMLQAAVASAWSMQMIEDEGCDRPIQGMMRLFFIMLACALCNGLIMRRILCYDLARDGPDPPLRVRAFHRCLLLGFLMWPIVTTIFLKHAEKCDARIMMSAWMIVSMYCLLIFFFCVIPFLFFTILTVIINFGVLALPRNILAAPENFISRLPVVPYEKARFGNSPGCCMSYCTVCLEPFTANCTIVCLPCKDAISARGHVFHYKCMDAWLSFARTCPLCRRDVVEACESQAAAAGAM